MHMLTDCTGCTRTDRDGHCCFPIECNFIYTDLEGKILEAIPSPEVPSPKGCDTASHGPQPAADGGEGRSRLNQRLKTERFVIGDPEIARQYRAGILEGSQVARQEAVNLPTAGSNPAPPAKP